MQRITGAKKAADPPSGGPQVSLAAGREAARWGTADAELRSMQGSEHTGARIAEWRWIDAIEWSMLGFGAAKGGGRIREWWKGVLHGGGGIWGGPGAIRSSAHLGRIGRGVGGEHGRISAPKMSIGSFQGRRWVGRGFEVDGQAGGATRGRSHEFPQVTGEIERNWSECRVVTSSSERRAGWRTFGEPRRGGRGGREEGAQPLRGKQDHTYRRDGTSAPRNEEILLKDARGKTVDGAGVVDMFWDWVPPECDGARMKRRSRESVRQRLEFKFLNLTGFTGIAGYLLLRMKRLAVRVAETFRDGQRRHAESPTYNGALSCGYWGYLNGRGRNRGGCASVSSGARERGRRGPSFRATSIRWVGSSRHLWSVPDLCWFVELAPNVGHNAFPSKLMASATGHNLDAFKLLKTVQNTSVNVIHTAGLELR
ncbi:hypothetical protein FB451DRAFT_1195742 [Mycena latifolia]|nr:hypothetical protein FB451DRAFT_1195742 [Mycena latifolia]